MFVSLFLCIVVFNFCQSENVPRLDGKIIGGKEVTIEEFPYQVSLQSGNRHMCGASIISPKFILTAAHCTNGIDAKKLKIRAGSSHRNTGGILIPVKHYYQHPDYSGKTINNDISILELAEELTFSDKIQPIALVNEDEEPSEGTEAVCTGWGTIKEGGKSSDTLQMVKISIVARKQCLEEYKNFNKITERMICAGVPKGGKDACQGDSGGPLVTDGKLSGVVSWGIGCGRPDYSGVYANVATLRGHVKKIVGF